MIAIDTPVSVENRVTSAPWNEQNLKYTQKVDSAARIALPVL